MRLALNVIKNIIVILSVIIMWILPFFFTIVEFQTYENDTVIYNKFENDYKTYTSQIVKIGEYCDMGRRSFIWDTLGCLFKDQYYNYRYLPYIEFDSQQIPIHSWNETNDGNFYKVGQTVEVRYINNDISISAIFDEVFIARKPVLNLSLSAIFFLLALFITFIIYRESLRGVGDDLLHKGFRKLFSRKKIYKKL